MFAEMDCRYPFWKYQEMILEVVEQQIQKDTKYHIVAPPGSGKTIVGLELIRRFANPAVVFAPTTTIQKQWQEKLSLFTEDSNWIMAHSSLNPRELADISILTYQSLSTPGENLEFVEKIAIQNWQDDLCLSGTALNQEEARDRILKIFETNPKTYRSEISKRYRRIKRSFLSSADFDGRQFLHPNAQDLINRIVRLGVKTIILDECHHLLDYWAFILHELIRVLPDVRVIGLTATLPDPANQQEFENYDSLLGEVDFEVPTPAVVKEGNLAPFRDLVYFCKPSQRENQYLQNIQTHFEQALETIVARQSFQEWVLNSLIHHRLDGASGNINEAFEQFFNREPAFCVAACRFLNQTKKLIPAGIVLIEEMLEPMELDDWLLLMENFALRVVKLSSEPDDRQLYQQLQKVLLSFGISITERGFRHQRSPGELVLTLSESKDRAVVDILRAEMAAMGSRLRAIVITDFEHISARSRRLEDVLDKDAGSAVRVFRTLINDPHTNQLDPILVTGNLVLVDADKAQQLEEEINAWVERHKMAFTWAWKETSDPRILELDGNGISWRSRTYVSLVTDLFEKGFSRCLVGTRGLFGEGWDALSLSTLINLTSVTTSTSTRQLRGRTIRLDPNWPRKVAHNWDVVCYSKKFERGDIDVKRLMARHKHTWGIIVRPPLADFTEAVSSSLSMMEVSLPLHGQIVRGVWHVDIDLGNDLLYKKYKFIDYEKYNQRMLSAVQKRDQVYDLWKVGEQYSNFVYSATHVNGQDLKFKTVYTLSGSLKNILRRLFFNFLGLLILVWYYGFSNILQIENFQIAAIGCLFVLILGFFAATLVNLNEIRKVFKRYFLEMPADAVLYDIGRALLLALRDAGLVSRNLNEKYVRVTETGFGELEVFLDYASAEDSDTFARAYQQLLGPIGDARYLIERNSSSLRNLIHKSLWFFIRRIFGRGDENFAYHRVPDILASRKERAEFLSKHWTRYVGGGRLIFTRSEEGRKLLLNARKKPRRKIRQLAFEFWK